MIGLQNKILNSEFFILNLLHLHKVHRFLALIAHFALFGADAALPGVSIQVSLLGRANPGRVHAGPAPHGTAIVQMPDAPVAAHQQPSAGQGAEGYRGRGAGENFLHHPPGADEIQPGGHLFIPHGAQDGQKFMGVVLLCLYMSNGQALPSDIDIPIWLMLVCSIIMGLGTAIGGKKIIKSVGMDMVKLEKYQGFSADIAAAISLFFSSTFGIPVSTTHAKTTAIMGVGAVKRLSAINFGVVKEMAMTWLLTFPGCGLIGFLMTKLFMYLF